MTAKTSLLIYFILGTFFIILGLLIGNALPPFIDSVINQQISITPGSQSYPSWKETPTPIYQKFFFFNVTNPQGIEMGEKPALEEIGPFTYRCEWRNEDIELSDDQSSIDFRHIKHWHFEPELSIADHRLQIVTINAPLAITMSLIQNAPNAVRYFVTFSLDGFSEGFFTKRSIRQLLFDGYPDLLTTMGPFLNSEMLSQGGQFAYFNSKNNSEDGHYEVNTGFDDINELNTIKKFNGRTQLPYWNKHQLNGAEGQCNSLKGATTGEMFPPMINVNVDKNSNSTTSTLRLFQPDFCRVWPLHHEFNYDHQSGLRLRRFRASRDIFRNYTDFPENSCYYPNIDNHSLNNHIQNNRLSSSSSHENGRSRNNNNHHHQQQTQQAAAMTANQQNDINNNNSNRIPSVISGQLSQQQQQQQQQIHQSHHRPSIFNRQGRLNQALSAGQQIGSSQRHPRPSGAAGQAQAAAANPVPPGAGYGRVRLEWPNGVFTLAPCKFNAPIYLSMPHFLDADPFFANQVDGLKPDAEKHDFYLDIEPRTGAPVRGAARVQINLAISRPPGLIRFRNIPEIMFPVFWQELSVELSGTLVDNLLLASRQAQEITKTVSYVFLIMGTAILVTIVLFYIWNYKGDSR